MKIKKNIPNILSSLRLLSPAVLIPLIIAGNFKAVGLLLIGFFATDALDGYLARKWHVESELGAQIDAVADKFMLTSFLAPLALNNVVVVVNIILESLIALVNTSRKLSGESPKTNKIGKVKMAVTAVFIIISYLANMMSIPVELCNTLFFATTILQAATLAKYTDEAKKEIRRKGESNGGNSEIALEQNTGLEEVLTLTNIHETDEHIIAFEGNLHSGEEELNFAASHDNLDEEEFDYLNGQIQAAEDRQTMRDSRGSYIKQLFNRNK